MAYHTCDDKTKDFYEGLISDMSKEELEKHAGARKSKRHTMPHFEDQDRSQKSKDIFHALDRDHPNMPAEEKARIAGKQGNPGNHHQGPPYTAPIHGKYSKKEQEADEEHVENTSKGEREKEVAHEKKETASQEKGEHQMEKTAVKMATLARALLGRAERAGTHPDIISKLKSRMRVKNESSYQALKFNKEFHPGTSFKKSWEEEKERMAKSAARQAPKKFSLKKTAGQLQDTARALNIGSGRNQAPEKIADTIARAKGSPTSQAEMVEHFKSLPATIQEAMAAKARAVVANLEESAMKRNAAKAMLKALGCPLKKIAE